MTGKWPVNVLAEGGEYIYMARELCVRGQQYDEIVTTMEGNLKLCLRNMQCKAAFGTN
jgi:hypothetical protein